MSPETTKYEIFIFEFDGILRCLFQSIKIRNFTSDFADGLAFCAIVHHYFPDAFDFNTLNRNNKQENFDLAFRIAE